MNSEHFKTICERWRSFAGRHPHVARYAGKLANYAQNGIMRDSEAVEFNVRFTGRMPRQTFWLTIIGLALMALAALVAVRITLWVGVQLLNIVELMVGGLLEDLLKFVLHGFRVACVSIGYTLLYLFIAWLLIVAVSAAVRRMHDIGKSGWYALIAFIPGIGLLIFAMMCCIESVKGDEGDAIGDDEEPSDDEEPVDEFSHSENPTPQQSVSCSLCHGEGKLPNGFPCPQCGGSGKA